MYDPINDTIYPQNGFCTFGDGANNQGWISEYNEIEDMFCSCDTYTSRVQGGRLWYANPFYLATINNLQETISKTDNDILQIKYTLVSE